MSHNSFNSKGEEHLAKSNQVRTTIQTKISDAHQQLQKLFYIVVWTFFK
jgi:hypothetical protein